MVEAAEITCLTCGRFLGTVQRNDGRLVWLQPPASANAARVVGRKGAGLVCSRCGGKALIGPMERVITYAA